MIKVGLTGGIGCGKSTVSKNFASKGISIIDADKIAHNIIAPETKALKEIIVAFGKSLLQKDGSLNRAALKKQVFSDTKKLLRLEAILDPKIYAAIEKQLVKSEALANTSRYIIADIPLLLEKNYNKLFDYIVVVDCLPEQQIKRIQQRDNMKLEIIQSIIDKQISREKRLKQATHILDNSGSKEQLLLQIEALHQEFIRLDIKSAYK